MNIQMKWFYRIGFYLLLLIAVYILIKLQLLWMPVVSILAYLLTPFLIAGFITYLLHPIVEKLHNRGLHRGIAVFLIYVVFFGGIGIALYEGIPAFISQIKDLSESAPGFADQYRSLISKVQSQTREWPNGIQERLNSGIAGFEQKLDSLFSKVVNSLVNIVDSALTIAVIPFIAFYMLKDFDFLKKTVWYMTPKKWRKQGIRFLKDVDESLGSYIRGQLLVCVIMGLISSLLFWFFGLRFPLLLGLIIALTNVIPYFGPIIGAIPAVVIAAATSTELVLITVAIVFSLQFIEGNILSPYIVGKSLHMHPLLIMLSLLAGGRIGGIPGLIIAVPVLAVVKVSLTHAKGHFTRVKGKKIEPQ